MAHSRYKTENKSHHSIAGILFLFLIFLVQLSEATPLTVDKDERIVLLGSGLGSRMSHFGHFETELQLRNPDKKLIIRNMCDEGNTPGFRPHPGRDSPWAFPGAEKFQTELAKKSGSSGIYMTPDQWLSHLKADTIIAFFGFNSSFNGPAGLENFKGELGGFIEHTLKQNYNGEKAPKLAIVSPSAFEDVSHIYNAPDATLTNKNLGLYTEAMRTVCSEYGILFIDLFTSSNAAFNANTDLFTRDGALLNDKGYQWLAPQLADGLYGKSATENSKYRKQVHAAVNEKNWCWLNDYKMPNGVQIYGRRGGGKNAPPQNYRDEYKKTREMTALRDQAIWTALQGKEMDLTTADAKTFKLSPVKSNYKPSGKNGKLEYQSGPSSQTKITTANGYQMELFASEKEFTDLANPVQVAFDNKGRLWVATMPSYPHYRIGDPKPSDKLIILEDTDNDGKADKQTTFADDLHIPMGFEITSEGVYVAQSGHLVLLKDTDGDDQYDVREVILSGFDDHDTHHAISAFSADPSGAILMGEGVFLHSNVETAYGPVRATNGGFFRYSPQRKKLIRYAQLHIPNPWGIAHDDYGQDFFLHTSGPATSWMLPGTVKSSYAVSMYSPGILKDHKVRPTSGLEFISSRHFPDDVQGDLLICNNIGFLGAKQHRITEKGAGFKAKWHQDLFRSADTNFRPVDLEFAPDGSLYVADWHNALIGHAQHNQRDPNRDHVHGRIYRITYPSRELVKPAQIHGASITELLENLKLPEARTRYRTRRELRGRNANDVLPLLKTWAAKQTSDHHKLEALWVSWGHDQVDTELLKELLRCSDHRVRAAAVRVLRFNTEQLPDYPSLLMAAASDEHGRVRLEAITAASWLPEEVGLPIVETAAKKPLESSMKSSHRHALAKLKNEIIHDSPYFLLNTKLKGDAKKIFGQGAEIYNREGHCATCHQQDGKGLVHSGFPPLDKSKWVTGSKERLIKLTLHGLHGPITVKDKQYPGQVPMTAFKDVIDDEETAAVLTFVRNSFGNNASVVTSEEVAAVREATKDKEFFYSPEELLEQHPHK